MIFPTEIIEQIVLETGELRIADIFKKYISSYVYDQLEKNILIVGNVQSGKTKEIIKYINKEKDAFKVLVLQNSKLILNQYINRFKNEKIQFQVITKDTKIINKKLVILINNFHRYAHFQKINNQKYILMIDEADMCINTCPLQGYKNVHITATPYNFSAKKTVEYNRIIHVEKNDNYYHFDRLNVHIKDNIVEIINDFLNTDDNGMLLINRYASVNEMKNIAYNLSLFLYTSSLYLNKQPVPIILLTSEKKYYLNHVCNKLPKNISVSQIIDMFKEYKHVIFIANRLANRGVSFVSSDYSRHLTHQVSSFKSTVANFIQSIRLLGIYKNNPHLNLYITSYCEKFISHPYLYSQYNIDSQQSISDSQYSFNSQEW